jgi:signal transduction histidine kinase/CheY-like chemotaxis protein
MLTEEDARRHPVAKIRGIVTYADAGWNLFFLEDDTGGVRVEGVVPQGIAASQLVDIEGIVVSGGDTPTITDASVKTLPETPGLPSATLSANWSDPGLACRRVEVHGIVRSAALAGTGRLRLVIRSDGQEIKGWVSDPVGIDFPHLAGTTVKVRGVATTTSETGGAAKWTNLWIANARDIELVSAPSGKQRPVQRERLGALTTVSQVHQLSAGLAAQQYPVHLKTTVTFYDPAEHTLFVQDASGGVYVSAHSLGAMILKPGQQIELDGLTGAGEFAPIIESPRVKVLAEGIPPAPARVETEEIFSGKLDSVRVQVEGVMQSLGSRGDSATFNVVWGDHRFLGQVIGMTQLPAKFEDADVRIRGVCATRFNFKRQLLGIRILVADPSDIELLAPGPDAFKLPVMQIAGLMQFSPDAKRGHRVRIQGAVTLANPQGPTFIQDETGGVVIRKHNNVAVQPGDVVDVAGFAESGDFTPVMRDGELRKIRSSQPVTAARFTAEEILEEGYDAQLVQVDAFLRGQTTSRNDETLVMQAGRTLFDARVPRTSPLPPLEKGALLRLTGISNIKLGETRDVLPQSFELQLRSGNDIAILRAAPWWKLERVLAVLGLAGACVLVSLLWAMTLRRRVHAQTQIIEAKLLQEEKLKEAAQQASHAKSEFLANMSHEIRTPMNGVLGMIELVSDSELTSEQREHLEMAKVSANSLLSLINDILDFSKVEAGMLELDPVEFPFHERIEEIARLLAITAHQKGLELICDIDPLVPEYVIADPVRIRQVVVNLMGNAVKFTERGEVVLSVRIDSNPAHVTTETVGLVLLIAVRDTGIGVLPSKQRQIFQPFSQADGSTTRKYGGTGLGLTISKRLVEMMGGRIWLESEPGAGATFFFTLPVGHAAEKSQERATLDPAILLGCPVLVVDDNATNRRVLADRLNGWGMTPTMTDSAATALAALDSCPEPFPIILSDVHMPELDGFDLVARIRSQPRFRGTAIAMLTSGSMPGDIARCRELGVEAYLTKPVRQSELLTILLKMLNAHRSRIAGPESLASMHSAVAGGSQNEIDSRTKTTQAATTTRLHILLAEDNRVNQTLAARLLGKSGHTVTIAADGREALAILERESFDLVLMDVQMPEMDGFEATLAIRARERDTGMHIPIVAMTARAMSGDREKCLQSGMDDYVSKPIIVAELSAAIDRVMSSRESHPKAGLRS